MKIKKDKNHQSWWNYSNTVVPEPGGAKGATAPPQYLSDQLNLFEPGRADYPHLEGEEKKVHKLF